MKSTGLDDRKQSTISHDRHGWRGDQMGALISMVSMVSMAPMVPASWTYCTLRSPGQALALKSGLKPDSAIGDAGQRLDRLKQRQTCKSTAYIHVPPPTVCGVHVSAACSGRDPPHVHGGVGIARHHQPHANLNTSRWSPRIFAHMISSLKRLTEMRLIQTCFSIQRFVASV